MNTDAVASLFRQYCDESDTTFLTDANVVTFLNIGYNQFRQLVNEQDDHYYMIRTFISIPGAPASSCDLSATAPPLMGQTAADDARIERIVRVGLAQDGVGTTDRDIRYYLQAARSIIEIQNGINRYFLQGTILRFTGEYNRIVMEYVPFGGNKFTAGNIVGGGGQYIDELAGYHDLIALVAYQQYAIKDFAANPVLQAQLATRQQQLVDYLQTGRNWAARNQVITTDELDYLGY